MSTISEAQLSASQRRLTRPRLILAGVLALLAGGIIAGCVGTTPADPAAPTAATTVAATAMPAAPAEPTATSAAPQGTPQGVPPERFQVEPVARRRSLRPL